MSTTRRLLLRWLPSPPQRGVSLSNLPSGHRMPHSAPPPSLRFCCPEALHAKVLHLLETLERARDPTRPCGALGDRVVEWTPAGMDDYFLQPLRLAKAGFLVQQTANLGVASATRIMAPIIRNIIGRPDKNQLLSISGYIRHLMR